MVYQQIKEVMRKRRVLCVTWICYGVPCLLNSHSYCKKWDTVSICMWNVDTIIKNGLSSNKIAVVVKVRFSKVRVPVYCVSLCCVCFLALYSRDMQDIRNTTSTMCYWWSYAKLNDISNIVHAHYITAPLDMIFVLREWTRRGNLSACFLFFNTARAGVSSKG